MNGSPPAADVRAQLERLLSSQALGGSEQLKRLLKLVVERTLDGQSELLKEYNLGLEVFQRAADYDPKVDPIVRVQARRLRAKLDEYYAGEGAHDPVSIQIPKGAYVPAFGLTKGSSTPAFASQPSARRRTWTAVVLGALTLAGAMFLWISNRRSVPAADIDSSVAVLPMKSFAEGREGIANEVSEVLTTQLAKNSKLRVLSRTTASKYRETPASLPEIARTLGVRWIVEGGVGAEGNRAYMKLRVVDSQTDRKVWANVFDCQVSELVAVNARAADDIAAAIIAQIRAAKP